MTLIILTGAGISAESGVPTFRDRHGLWDKFDWQRLATPEAFEDQPELVHEFYNARRSMMRGIKPNAGHDAIARLDRELKQRGKPFLLVTQNVDDLHRRAGSDRMVQMHGRLDRVWCIRCHKTHDWLDDCFVDTACPACGNKQALRPDIVWFGEVPKGLDQIERQLDEVTEFVAIGTSGTVYPAAAFVAEARSRRAKTTELNLEPGENANHFDASEYGAASEIVPRWVEAYLLRNDKKDL